MAEQSFRDELAIHPRNGWAFKELEAAPKGQGKNTEARTARRDVASTWPLAAKTLRGALSRV